MTAWVVDWLRAFGVTLAAEVIVVVPLLARVEARLGRRIAAVALANLATHPLVWFLFPGLTVGYAARVGISEIWAVVAETGAYLVIWPGLGSRRAAMVSLIANGVSLVLGLVLRAVHMLP